MAFATFLGKLGTTMAHGVPKVGPIIYLGKLGPIMGHRGGGGKLDP